MLKKFTHNLISISILGIFLSSCAGKKENFDIDLSNFKVPNKNEAAAPNPLAEKLSRRELQVLEGLSKGKSNKEIADKVKNKK